MFQTFDSTTSPEQGPPRLSALRQEIAKEGLDGYLVPRADRHQGEYVTARDERLAWLTGFTGSAGFCAVLKDVAGIFVDGRYRLQVRMQAADVFTPVDWPETKLGDWLVTKLPAGGKIGFDPWLHTLAEIEAIETAAESTGITLVDCENLVDRIWEDRPAAPDASAVKYPAEFAGKGDETKRAELAQALKDAGQNAVVLTMPDSICWLLNIRGGDIPRTPIVQAFAIFGADGQMQLFSEPAKFAGLGPDPAISLRDWSDFPAALDALSGPVRVDKGTAPVAVIRRLRAAGVEVALAADPCALPKARKNAAEIAGTREAHLRDAAAMCNFLAWLDTEAPKGGLTEIDVVQKLEGFRRETNALRDISFETICGAGPNGAIMHYRVTNETNRPIGAGDLVVIDSGGQYLDGTTDITRTVAIGPAGDDERACFTRVLQGMIAISRARWPVGLAGRDLDPLARIALWRAGQDYNHGTGHGVGVFLGVHEGPARIARISDIPLEPGMILSNEPGYYRDGSFGIRIENLVVVQEALEKGDHHRAMLDFETITWVPIDRNLIDAKMLSADERDWLNTYHAEVATKVGPRVSGAASDWLSTATAPL